MSLQLPLGIGLRQHFEFDSFVPGENRHLIESLRSCASGSGEPFIFIWGATGAGKTHLLQASCRLADDRGLRSIYIPLAQLPDLSPDMIEGLENLSLVCLDDLQSVAGRNQWEQAVFRLFNDLRERRAHLLVAAQSPPSSLRFGLSDLASRMGWGPCYRIQDPNDLTRLQILVLGARRRGLELDEGAGRYLLRRCRRDMHSLQGLLDLLDQASLAAKRRLTLPFVREVLDRLAPDSILGQRR